MNRNGLVTGIRGERALVRILKHTACGECGACTLGDDNKQLEIECLNEPGAQVGEYVQIDLESPNVLGAAFIMYMIPLLALLVGVFGGSYLFGSVLQIGNKDFAGAIIGVALMVVTYFSIKGKEAKFAESQKYLSRITKVDRSELNSACENSTMKER